MKKLIAGLIALSALGGFAAGANANGNWTRFKDRDGNRVVIKTDCLNEEDTAGHLKLIDYTPRPGTIAVYGCYKRGY